MWKQLTGNLENRWRSVDMEYRGMKEDERLVSVKPSQRQMMQTFKRFQNGIQRERMGMFLEQIIMTAYSEMKLAAGN